MKYLLVSPDYPPPFIGGSLVWLYNLIENCPEDFDILTCSLKKGCSEVASPRHRIFRSRFLVDSVSPGRVGLAATYLYMVLWVFLRSLFVRYEAILVNPGALGNSLLILAGRLLGIPVIATAQGEEITLELYGRDWKSALKRRLMRWAYPKASGFFSVSHFARRLLIEMKIDPDRIDVIPSCLNPAKAVGFVPKTDRGYKVLSVGRLIERKGFHLLIEAIRRLKPDLPQLTLTVVGDGPMRPHLEKQISDFKLEGSVFLRRGLTDAELSRLYQESDLFVLAHFRTELGDTEGCPTVFSEAMGAGLPLIGGTGGGADTAIIEGKNGFIVDSRDIDQLADRVRRILTDPALAESMGQFGMEKLRRDHDPRKAGLALAQHIHRVLRREPATGYQWELNNR